MTKDTNVDAMTIKVTDFVEPVPLRIASEGKVILCLKADGTLELDPRNASEAARMLVAETRRWCHELGQGDPFAAAQLQQAREEERAACVAWIRDGRGPYIEGYGGEIADAIEAGEHREVGK